MRAVVLALSAVLLFAAPARAGTMLLAPVISGAGTVYSQDVEYSCTKTNDFNDDASTKCPAQFVDGMSVWLSASPAPNSDFTFAGWQGCTATRGTGAATECNVAPPASGSAERNPVARFADTIAPATTLASVPSGRVVAATAKPTFGSPDALASFRCRFDSAAYAPCASGTEYTLADGPHTFSVLAVDPSGNVGPAQTATWEVDASPPTVALAGGPDEGSATPSRSAAFELVASADTKTTTCTLNGAPCSLPIQLSSLADGAYTLTVTVSDGLREASATRTWTIDTVAPDTAIGDAFAFSANEPGVSFECSLDGGPFGACPSAAALNGQGAGAHVLAVRARDRAGNVDATPASYSWRILAGATRRAIAFTVPYFVTVAKRGTTFTSLALKGVPAGATIKLTCKGGCPRRAQTIKSKKGGTVQLAAFRHRVFKPGAKLTIAVTAPGLTGMAKTFTFRTGKRPKITTKALALAS